MPLTIRQYVRRLKGIKKGIKVALLIVNLTFTAVNDSELLALLRESYNHMVKLKQVEVSGGKGEN